MLALFSLLPNSFFGCSFPSLPLVHCKFLEQNSVYDLESWIFENCILVAQKTKALTRKPNYFSMKLLGGVEFVMVGIINLIGSGIIFETHLWAHGWSFQVEFNCGGKNYAKYEWHHSMPCGPKLNKEEKAHWAPTFISLCFLTLDTTWPAVSCSWGPVFPTMMDLNPQTVD